MVFPYSPVDKNKYVANLQGFQNLVGLNTYEMQLETLEKNAIYHVYNRGNNGDKIFLNDENKRYFLDLANRYLSGKCNILAYCLMNNHFHFVIEVISNGKEATQAFSNLFNAYAKAFNKFAGRTGSLFEKHIKRIRIDTANYLMNLIIYVHQNPARHTGADFKNYKYSSYHEIIGGESKIITTDTAVLYFGSVENFKYVHNSEEVKFKH